MLERNLTEKARDLGFIAVGFSRPEVPRYFDKYLEWLKKIDTGDMDYLRRNLEARKDPAILLKGLKTVISLAYPYPANKPCSPDGYCVSRYSSPDREDYHILLKRLGRELCWLIKDRIPGSCCRVCVDSAPILERSFALAGGIGFIGKNNTLIIPGYGSYFFLMEILTTVEFPVPLYPEKECRCGECTECIDACPTGALKEPFFIDVSRCLSYLTIEYKGAVDRETGRRMGNTFFGCDRCQEACPFNSAEAPVVSLPSMKDIRRMTDEDFKRVFGKTALSRAGLKKIKENIKAIGERTHLSPDAPLP